MRKKLATAATALASAAALTACSDQAGELAPDPEATNRSSQLETDNPNPSPSSPEALDEQTETDRAPSAKSSVPPRMIKGSNEEEAARKIDPKRSKLIKADPN